MGDGKHPSFYAVSNKTVQTYLLDVLALCNGKTIISYKVVFSFRHSNNLGGSPNFVSCLTIKLFVISFSCVMTSNIKSSCY